MNRSSNDNCLLCKKGKATQTNSHIVPKFMSKGILGNQGPRKAFIINNSEPEKRSTVCQDSPKESYILCPSCESYFQVLETYISEHLHKRILNEKYKDDFLYKKNSAGIPFAACLNTNLLVAKLFFFSIYWRCSITSIIPFKEFQIIEEEELRNYILRFKTNLISDLIKKQDELRICRKSLIVMRYTKKINQKDNFLLAVVSNDNTYGLVLNEYMTFLAIDETTTTRTLKDFANQNVDPFLVIIANDKNEKFFRQLIINNFRDSTINLAKEKVVLFCLPS